MRDEDGRLGSVLDLAEPKWNDRRHIAYQPLYHITTAPDEFRDQIVHWIDRTPFFPLIIKFCPLTGGHGIILARNGGRMPCAVPNEAKRVSVCSSFLYDAMSQSHSSAEGEDYYGRIASSQRQHLSCVKPNARRGRAGRGAAVAGCFRTFIRHELVRSGSARLNA